MSGAYRSSPWGPRAASAVFVDAVARMRRNRIIEMAQEVLRLQAEGREVCNLTIGDFDPAEFPLPAPLRDGIAAALAEGHTNYPPPDGLPELRAAVSDLYARELGWEPGADAVVACSGARPAIYAAWRSFVRPGDRTVSFQPAWNVGYYADLAASDHLWVPTRPEHGFFPTVEQFREAIRGARLVLLNTPCNPTGTAVDADALEGMARALVEENRRRGWDAATGRTGDEPPCILVYDQVYWMLRAPGVEHHVPAQLVPECAPFVVHVDAVSKWLAATGLRVGWAVLPPFLARRFAALVGHMGAWAPRAEQVAVAALLARPDLLREHVGRIALEVHRRLRALYEGILALRDRGLPVDAIEPAGALHLSFRVDPRATRLGDAEGVRRYLLEEAGLAVVPFSAFDMDDDDGWLRMSVGTVRADEIPAALERLEAALRRR